jgi:hypothetical protein
MSSETLGRVIQHKTLPRGRATAPWQHSLARLPDSVNGCDTDSESLQKTERQKYLISDITISTWSYKNHTMRQPLVCFY